MLVRRRTGDPRPKTWEVCNAAPAPEPLRAPPAAGASPEGASAPRSGAAGVIPRGLALRAIRTEVGANVPEREIKEERSGRTGAASLRHPAGGRGCPCLQRLAVTRADFD